MYPFLEEANKVIPTGAKVAYLTTNLGPYLTYYLYDNFQIVKAPEAEYLLVYYLVTPFRHESDGSFYIDKEKIGQFDVLASFSPNQIILKRR